jgi:hypothetical protein
MGIQSELSKGLDK